MPALCWWLKAPVHMCGCVGALWTLDIILCSLYLWNLRVIQVGEDIMESLGPLTCS